MYQFVDLTDDQKHERRYLLDYYAALAQISVFVPLLLVQISRLIKWILKKRRRAAAVQAPSSPYLKMNQLGFQGLKIGRLKYLIENVIWWCGDSVEVLHIYLGTKGELVGASVWVLWLLVLCFVQTGQDYLHLTKRFGSIAGSQLPLHYLLSMKSPYSPLQILTSSSHETLISIHQLIGRIITVLIYLHAIFYFNFYVLKGLVIAKLKEFYVLCGIFAVLAFTIIGITSLASFRHRKYKLFYLIHVFFASILLPTLYFHVSHIRIYLYEAGAIYLISTALRAWRTRPVDADLQLLPEASGLLLSITIPVPQNKVDPHAWQPGQHAYISIPGSGPVLRGLHSNPFTAASLPAHDARLRFVARVRGGNTAVLAREAARTQRVLLEGPYGVPDHAERLLSYNRVLFVAGGVGATFVAPIYRQLLADLAPAPGASRRQRVSFVWAVRGLGEMAWALPSEGREREGFTERLRVYVTGTNGEVATSPVEAFVVGDDEEGRGNQGFGAGGEEEEGIELQERKTLLADDRPQGAGAVTKGVVVQHGRPDVRRVIEQTFSHGVTERIAVLVCGPRGLSQAVRREVGKMVKSGRDVFFWEETFAT